MSCDDPQTDEGGHYEVRVVLPPDCPAAAALEASRRRQEAGSGPEAVLPRGPAHISLLDFQLSTGRQERACLGGLRDACARASPLTAALRVAGRAEARRGGRQAAAAAHALPVALSEAAEGLRCELLDGLSHLSGRGPRRRLHVSVGKGAAPPDVESWEGPWDGITVLRFESRRSRRCLAVWDLPFLGAAAEAAALAPTSSDHPVSGEEAPRR
ncbi:unnamed protein product [Prorocentrum cordatum]|uniref:Protein kinase A anchor protein nuclear localisation signal domain-containing protein n=1 Tax=Prorocentrum cordatum TaxID=2364126 RepID=A0ABN9UUT7_9DINO|nr:unnamed protein product [Polarella glacialis]